MKYFILAAISSLVRSETCVTLDSTRFYYRRLESNRAALELRLEHDSSSDYALYDESTIKVQYTGCYFTNIQRQYPVESASIDNTQTQLIFDFSEKQSGKTNLRFEYRWQASDNTCDVSAVELCRGVSPTQAYLNFNNYISSHDCEHLDTSVLTVPNVWLGRAYMRTWFRGTTTSRINAGDYVELEFSGPMEFSNVYFPIREAVRVEDNVWRLFFSQTFRTNQFYFESEVKFTGSTFHKPNLNWIQKCTADSLDADGVAKGSGYGGNSSDHFMNSSAYNNAYQNSNNAFSYPSNGGKMVVETTAAPTTPPKRQLFQNQRPTQRPTYRPTQRPTYRPTQRPPSKRPTQRPYPPKQSNRPSGIPSGMPLPPHMKPQMVLKPVVTRPKKNRKEPKKRLKKNGKCCRLTLAEKAAKRLKKLQGRINRQINTFASKK